MKQVQTITKSLTVLILMICQVSFAQNYGNEWIDFSKEYFKVQDSREGIYKLTYQELANAGFPVNQNPQEFQLYRKGQEMAIRVIGEADGSFDAGDYILFYGQKLDGRSDEELYASPSDHTNPYVNLYSDTSAYFLTHSITNATRITTNSSETSVNKTYVEKVSLFTFLEAYSLGDEPVNEVFLSEFDTGEGWMQSAKWIGKNPLFGTPDVSNAIDIAGYQPKLEIKLAGRNKYSHTVSITIGENNPTTYDFTSFDKYNTLTQTFDWDINQIKDDNLLTTGLVIGNGSNQDYVSVVYSKYFFPISPNVNNSTPFYFNSLETNNSAVNVDFINIPSGSMVFDISDEYNVVELYKNNASNFILNQLQTGNKSYVLLTENDFLSPAKITKSSLKNDANLANPDYLIIYHKDFESAAQNFKTYRSSIEGGAYQVEIVDQDRLFDQYSYGERTPLSIRNYCRYMLDTYNPTHLLLLGNGNAVSIKNSGAPFYRLTTFDDSRYQNKDYVMTMGNPGSDIMFSNKMDGTSLAPELATGRIPCYTNEQAQIYLDKVIVHESLAYNDLWRKKVLHLSGGQYEGETASFLSMLNTMKDKAVGLYYGGEVTTFNKKSGTAVEFMNISQEVNNGVGLINFFGHSAANYAGIDIGLVSEDVNGYTNKGKYPILWLNGCNSTDTYHAYNRVRVTDWMFTKDKGAIGSFGHASYGYTFTLNNYTNKFYEYAFQDSTYSHKSLGQIQQKVIEEFSKGLTTNVYYQSHAQQFNYLGDPAIHYFAPQKPDYAINEQSISIDAFSGQGPITAVSDSFQLAIAIDNFGRALNDSLTICIDRVANNETLQSETFKVSPIFHNDTAYFTINNTSQVGGINTFTINLDCDNVFDELNKENNTVSISYFIPFNGITVLYPKPFAIIGDETVDLVFQSNDLLTLNEFNYELQLDTSATFDSPLLTKNITGDVIGTIKAYNLPITKDSTVYYWRVRFSDVPEEESPDWVLSSFTFIQGKSGWGQMEFDQFYDNEFSQINKNEAIGLWQFDQTGSHIIATSAGKNVTNFRVESTISVDGQALVLGERGGCNKNGLWILVFDKETAQPFSPNATGYGNCGRQPRLTQVFSNPNKANVQTAIITFLDLLDKNDMILVVSTGTHYSTTWSTALIDKFGEFGATQITNIPSNSHPYIFIGKKGESTALHEEIAPDDASILHVEYDLVGRLTVGVIKSPIIGPTNDWSTYSHKFEMQENDSITVAVYGIDQDGLKTATPIKTYENQKEIEIDLKNNDPIDAAIYPSVQFETYLYDTLDNSAPQINRWAITSKQLPEGVINTSAIGIENYHLSTVEVGYPLTFDFVFENISPIDFSDSVKVLVNLQGELRDSVINATLTPLKGGESLTYSLSLPTENLIGTNTLQVFFNPYNQLEAIYENNIVAIPFTVSADQTSPVIDVLFDNRHIKDGEIVSPNPEITIYYHDNNNYNIKQDTNGVFLFLQQPCEEGNCTYDRVYFSEQSVVSWTSQTENSPFTIQYSPTNLSDGVYFLKIHGQDQAGNLSSEEPYVISFEVVNHQSITNLTPFPNPFRTYCQFEFTLTGNEIPQDITIEIHSASGELVRTITYDELGVLHAGHNITDFKWYGTNDSGAQLANGLYIYRVIIENGDTNIEYIDTSDNKYKQGVGKIMIMR